MQTVDQQYDLVVVGTGGAAMAAGMEAMRLCAGLFRSTMPTSCCA